MIQATFIVFGMVHFINALFEKTGVWDWIEQQGSKANSKFIFDLSFCRFCLLFHLGWITTVVVACFGHATWSWLTVPFIVCGITHKIGKDGL